VQHTRYASYVPHKQEMSALTLYAAVCPVAQSLRRRQYTRPNNGVGYNVQSVPATLDPPVLPPVSKDDVRFWRFYVLTLTFDLSN